MMRNALGASFRLLPADRAPPAFFTRPTDEIRLEVLARPVLIIEDEGVIAWTLESMLEEMGFSTIAIAASGPDAVHQARQKAPGLIISDINLGSTTMDGVAASAAIVSAAKAAVVFISGFASAEARGRIERDMPGAALLRKPANAAELRRAIIAARDRS